MKHCAAGLALAARSTDNVHDGGKLRVRARDAVECRQLANAKRGHQCTEAANTRIAVGRIGCVKLIARPHPREARGSNVVESQQVEVARKTMDGVAAELVQSSVQVLGNINGTRCSLGSLWRLGEGLRGVGFLELLSQSRLTQVG